MINVSDKTVRAYTEYGCKKNITITFPGENIPAITNQNLQEESMKVIYGICQEDTLQTGGCNSSMFEITTFGILRDLTNKNIIVSLSVKDENYKGEWNYDADYSEGDIVKFDGFYYQYLFTPSQEDSGEKKRINVPFSDWEINEQKTQYNLSGRSPERLKGFRIDSNKEWPEGIIFKVKTWYNGGGYYWTKTIDNNNLNSDILFPLIDPYGSEGDLLGWFAEITYTGENVDEIYQWVESLRISSLTSIPVNKMYPVFLHDCCKRLYGYIDTSNVDDFIIFRGKIDCYERQSDPRYRTLVAYDKMYSLSSVNVQNWINTVDSNGKGYIEKYNYRGEWEYNVKTYKAGDTVRVMEEQINNPPAVAYYHYKKNMDVKLFQNLTPKEVANNIYPPSAGSAITTDGSYYIEKLTSYYPNRPTVKTLRNNLCKYLGIEQEEVNLPLDNMQLTIGEFKEAVSARQLLTWICNLNMVFGYIVPETGKLRYVFINKQKKQIVEDSNYIGDYSKEGAYEVGNIVSLTEHNFKTYYKNVLPLSNKAPSSYVETNIKNRFVTPVKGIRYFPPTPKGDNWYLRFEFDEVLAQELGIVVGVQPYRGDGGISLRTSGNVFLNSVFSGNQSFTIYIGENVTDEFWESFKVLMYTADGESAYNFEPDDPMLYDFWEKCNLLYHPSGRINLSHIYEYNNVNINDISCKNTGYRVVDTSDKVIFGSGDILTKGELNITYSPLYSKWKSAGQLYIDVNENVGQAQKYFTIEYTPYKITLLGLPFLEVGDYVCFDIMEWVEDENWNPVERVITVNSIVFYKEMSGINALMDEYEAR